MIVEFCRWGNSLAVRIPKTFADAVKVSEGKRAELKVERDIGTVPDRQTKTKTALHA